MNAALASAKSKPGAPARPGSAPKSANDARPPRPQMFLSTFADRMEPVLIEKVEKLLIRLFVAPKIPFSVVENAEFKDL